MADMKKFDMLMIEILKVLLEMEDFNQTKKRIEIFIHFWFLQAYSPLSTIV